LRDTSNRRAPDLLAAVYRITNAQLRSTFDYEASDIHPEAFLRQTKDTRYILSAERFFAITHVSFAQAAEATRTLVHYFVEYEP
jgi:hypothetical protein